VGEGVLLIIFVNVSVGKLASQSGYFDPGKRAQSAQGMGGYEAFKVGLEALVKLTLAFPCRESNYYQPINKNQTFSSFVQSSQKKRSAETHVLFSTIIVQVYLDLRSRKVHFCSIKNMLYFFFYLPP
jgi:hypothetical protein